MIAQRKNRLALLLGAEFVSTMGSAMTGLALPWLILVTTGSPSKAGLVVAVEIAPMALLAIPSGALASRLGPRRTMMVCDAVRAPATALLPILSWLDALPFAVALGLAAFVGAFFPAHLAAQRSLIPDIVGEDRATVTRANAILQTANRLPVVAGPALAGLLIVRLGAEAVLLVDACSYVLSFLLLYVFGPIATSGGRDESGLLGGAALVAKDRTLAVLTVTNASLELATQAIFLSLPILAYTAFDGDVSLGAGLLIAWGAGTLIGLPIAVQLKECNPIRVLRIGFMAQALPLWVLAQDLPVAFLVSALVVSGSAASAVGAPTTTLVSLRAPGPLRTKANLAYLTAVVAAGGLGVLLVGPLAEAIGIRSAIAAAAAVATLGSLLFVVATTTRNARPYAPDRVL